MNNIYKLQTPSIVKALNAIDNFNTKMEMFKAKHIKYSYETDVSSINNIWCVNFHINDEK